MKTNYILIDYENVQPTDIQSLDQEYFQVLVFLGTSQSKISTEVAIAIQTLGLRAKYIKICGSGSNALDFHIAFYIGRLSAQNPESYFHILSNDTGFDPLIHHLREQNIRVSRIGNLQEIPIIRIKHASTVVERTEIIITHFQRKEVTRPQTIKTLTNMINSLFQKTLSEAEVSLIVSELQKQRVICINETKVTYNLS